MSDDSDRPRSSISGAFPEESDPIRRALQKQARAQDQNVSTFKAHWRQMAQDRERAEEERKRIETESEERDAKLEGNLLRVSEALERITLKLNTVETKIALAASGGGFLGGLITSLIVRYVFR